MPITVEEPNQLHQVDEELVRHTVLDAFPVNIHPPCLIYEVHVLCVVFGSLLRVDFLILPQRVLSLFNFFPPFLLKEDNTPAVQDKRKKLKAYKQRRKCRMMNEFWFGIGWVSCREKLLICFSLFFSFSSCLKVKIDRVFGNKIFH